MVSQVFQMKQQMTKTFIFSLTPLIQIQCKMKKQTSPVLWEAQNYLGT